MFISLLFLQNYGAGGGLIPISDSHRFPPHRRQPGQPFLETSPVTVSTCWFAPFLGWTDPLGAQDQRVFLFAFLNSVFSAPWRARGCDVTV